MKIIFLFVFFFTMGLLAADKNINFTKSVIVTTPEMNRLEQKAVSALQDEIRKRTGISLKTFTPLIPYM